MVGPLPQGSVGGLEAVRFLADLKGLGLRLKQAAQPGFSVGAGGAAHDLLDLLEGNGPQSVPQLARTQGTSRQNIQVIVNRLKAEGWVELTRNPAHRRSDLVRMTAKGEAVFRDSPDPYRRITELLRENLSVDEIREGIRLVGKVNDLLSEASPRDARRSPSIRQRTSPKPAPDDRALPVPDENELPVSLL